PKWLAWQCLEQLSSATKLATKLAESSSTQKLVGGLRPRRDVSSPPRSVALNEIGVGDASRRRFLEQSYNGYIRMFMLAIQVATFNNEACRKRRQRNTRKNHQWRRLKPLRERRVGRGFGGCLRMDSGGDPSRAQVEFCWITRYNRSWTD